MDIVIRAAVAFLFILLVTRAIGRRELSGLEPFDLIMLVVLGDLIQQGVTQSDYSITGALVVVATMGALTVGMAWISYRFRRVRPVLEGDPRLTLHELEAEARLQQVASLDEIRWAVLETNGRISIIPRENGGGGGEATETQAA
ncbi:MAG: DUF421 domain-containing protein [Actinobacteria bacterium]|nr:MAG: DUF421 domain-containing protein [Actinomycetota bacterium]